MLGLGKGIYTLRKIPKDTVLMEYISEDLKEESKDGNIEKDNTYVTIPRSAQKAVWKFNR